MGKRDAQLVTEALFTLVDAREAIENGHADAALDALEEAQEVLISVKHTPGVSVAAASGRTQGLRADDPQLGEARSA